MSKRRRKTKAPAYPYAGREMTLREIASQPDVAKLGLTYQTIYQRVQLGWDPQIAFTAPLHARRDGTLRPPTTPDRLDRLELRIARLERNLGLRVTSQRKP